MKFIIATNNQKKLAELRDILTELGVYAVSLMDAGISSEVEETGSTFEENARLKAQAAMDILGIPAIADDSGLVVDALGGEPGIYSARYGGELLKNDTERCDFLRGKMTDVEDGARTARFVSAVACLFPDGREIITRGECEGTILRAPQGDGGFGYDPIFF
ncbi:MAG: non-canonical purine NTP pyrophosphatase, partial [Clostridia bacterium]